MTHPRILSAADQAPSTLAARLARTVRRSWQAYWHWRAKQATVQILGSLDARTLRDIGINPSEIESFVFGKGCQRVRLYDELWRGRSSS
jgi:uncharacterized protein YjiS (DUF1127 family)